MRYLGLPRVIYSEILWIILDNPKIFFTTAFLNGKNRGSSLGEAVGSS